MTRHYRLPPSGLSILIVMVALPLFSGENLAFGEQSTSLGTGSTVSSPGELEEAQFACVALEKVRGLRRSLLDFNKGERGTFADIADRLMWLNQNFSADISWRPKEITQLVSGLRTSGDLVSTREQILRETNTGLRSAQRDSSELISISSQIVAQIRAQHAPPARIAAAADLVTVAKRINQGATQLSISLSHMDETVFGLGGT